MLLDERWVMDLGEEKHEISNRKRGEEMEIPKGHFMHEPRVVTM